MEDCHQHFHQNFRHLANFFIKKSVKKFLFAEESPEIEVYIYIYI
jgi:hypothetical protein